MLIKSKSIVYGQRWCLQMSRITKHHRKEDMMTAYQNFEQKYFRNTVLIKPSHSHAIYVPI